MSRVLRYKVTTAVTDTPIYISDVGGSIIFATGAAAGQPLWEAVRVREVEVWGIDSAGGVNFTNVSVTWGEQLTGSRREIGTGNSQQPAHVRCKAPKGSLYRGWVGMNSLIPTNAGVLVTPMFYLTAPAGSIVDIHASFVMQAIAGADDALQTAWVQPAAGATAGVVYYNALDASLYNVGWGAGAGVIVADNDQYLQFRRAV